MGHCLLQRLHFLTDIVQSELDFLTQFLSAGVFAQGNLGAAFGLAADGFRFNIAGSHDTAAYRYAAPLRNADVIVAVQIGADSVFRSD
ncbi:hypothetical protein SDC9_142272 [bioreactor metagenome]|uniref:Uncharacterized protein n=1 Tax=bioreactor metagenome TaxID=1076179 RepID=A0A645E0P3_9ZZZZ